MESFRNSGKVNRRQSRSQRTGKSDTPKKTLNLSVVDEKLSTTSSSDDLEFILKEKEYKSCTKPIIKHMSHYPTGYSKPTSTTQNEKSKFDERSKFLIPNFPRTKLRTMGTTSKDTTFRRNLCHESNEEHKKSQRKFPTSEHSYPQSFQIPKKESRSVDFENIELKPKRCTSNLAVSTNNQVVTSLFISTETVQVPETTTRKKISPFLRQPSPMLRHFQKLLIEQNEEERVLPSSVSLDQYGGLVDRITKLETVVEQRNSEIMLELEGLKSRMNTGPRPRPRLTQTRNIYLDEDRSNTLLLQLRQAQFDKEKDQYYFLYGLLTTLGFILIIMTYCWIDKYLGGLSFVSTRTVQNWHIFLMVIALVFLNAQSMLTFRTSRYMKKFGTKWVPTNATIIHSVLQVVALVLAILSLKAAFDSHYYNNIPNMYTLHSWIGLGTTILYSLQLVVGVLHLTPKVPPNVKSVFSPLHAAIGNTCFVLIIASCLLGFMEKVTWALDSEYSQGTFHGYLVNSIGCLMIVFAGLVIYLTQEKKEY